MRFSGTACNKELGGGFKQEDGSFLCAACVIHKAEMGTNLSVFKDIVEMCDLIINGPKYSRPSRNNLREVRLKAKAIFEIRK